MSGDVYRRVPDVSPIQHELVREEVDHLVELFADLRPPVWAIANASQHAGVGLQVIYAELERRVREGQ